MTQLQKGDKVKTIYGDVETVAGVEDLRIFTNENLLSWYHPSKVVKLEITEIREFPTDP